MIYHAAVANRRTVSLVRFHPGHSGRYEIRVPNGFAIVATLCTDEDRMALEVTTEPLRWHPAYWWWRWFGREGVV